MRNDQNTLPDNAAASQSAHRVMRDRYPESKPHSHRYERRKVREWLRFSGSTDALADRLC